MAAVVLSAALSVACQGDRGPAGPVGPSGSGDLVLIQYDVSDTSYSDHADVQYYKVIKIDDRRITSSTFVEAYRMIGRGSVWEYA